MEDLKFSEEIEEKLVALICQIKDSYYERGIIDGKKVGYTLGYVDGIAEGKKQHETPTIERTLTRLTQIFKEIENIDKEDDEDDEQ